MRKYIYLYLVCLIFSPRLNAQHNSLYSQYLFNGLIVNPAYAGSQDATSLALLYRNQWLGIDGSPQTITFSAHSPLQNKKHNIGISFINDRFGISNHNITNLVYAYRVPFLKGHLAMGLQGGVDILKVNWANVRTTQENDPSFINNQTTVLPAAGAGLYYHSSKFFIGLSAPSLIYKNVFDPYFTSLLYTGMILNISQNIKLKPAIIFKYIKNSPLSFDAMTTFYYKDIIGVGGGYRLRESVIAFLDLKINEQFRIGYSYDYSVSPLRRYTSGSHEIVLRYLFLYKTNSQSARYF